MVFIRGANFTGLISGRENDVLGVGVAGLFANEDTPGDGVETHIEAYYRMVFGTHLALTTDLQYVISPSGESDDDNVFSGLVRLEAMF